MSTKKYCFIPETYKGISIYNPGSITDLISIDNGLQPSFQFKYYIDDKDISKIFYIDGKSETGAEENIEFFKYKTIQFIKSIFQVKDIHNYRLITDNHSRLEFTLFFDHNGVEVPLNELSIKNKFNTIIAHHYIYNFYKRYE